MDVRISIQRLTVPTISGLLAAGMALTALAYRNGYSLYAALAVGLASAAVGIWAIATEP